VAGRQSLTARCPGFFYRPSDQALAELGGEDVDDGDDDHDDDDDGGGAVVLEGAEGFIKGEADAAGEGGAEEQSSEPRTLRRGNVKTETIKGCFSVISYSLISC